MRIVNTPYGLQIEWGDGDVDYIYCEEADTVESALRKAFIFGGKAIYARAFEAGQKDEYSRRDVVTRHEMGG